MMSENLPYYCVNCQDIPFYLRPIDGQLFCVKCGAEVCFEGKSAPIKPLPVKRSSILGHSDVPK